MKKTLTTMALVSSAISPLSNSANTEAENDLKDLSKFNLESSEESIEIKKTSQLVTISKDNSFLIDEYGNYVTPVNTGDKLQVLKSYEGIPFFKVNYNGQALFIANESISESNDLAYSGTSLPLDCTGEIISENGDTVDVYNTDSTIGSILFNIQTGTHINIIEKTNNDWYKIDFYGNTGFVNLSNIHINNDNKVKSLSLEKNSSSKTGTVYNLSGTSKLNVRKQPTTKSSILTKLSKGTVVTILDNSTTGWYKIKVNNTIGYVSKSYIKENIANDLAPTDTTKYTVINTHINLRKSNSWSGTVVTEALIGSTLDVIEINGEWAKVYKDGQILYAPSKHLKKNDSEIINTSKYTVVNQSINLRKSASWSGSIYKTVNVGTVLDVVEITGVWATVYYDNKTLYAPASYLQANNAVPPIIEEEKPAFTETELSMDGVVYNLSSETSLNVRETPFTTSKILTTLNLNDIVNVIGITSNNWYKVDINGVIGYCNKSYIKEYVPQTTEYTVIETPINLRKEASWSGEIVEKVLVGTVLDVIEINGEWATIYRNKETLYAPSKYLSDGSSKPPVVEEQQPTFTESEMLMDGVVFGLPLNSTLSVRTTPFDNGDLVTVLKNDDRVNVIGVTSNDWYKVDINGNIGYVNKKYVKEYVIETTKYTVVNMPINLRRQDSWSGEIVKRVEVGTTLEVIKIDGLWASVYVNKEVLYAPSQYLSNEITPPSVGEDVKPPAIEEEKPPTTEENTPNFTVTDMKMHGIVSNVSSNDVLNVRNTPFVSGTLVTTLKNNTRVTVIGITSTNWYKIDVNGIIGYVNKSYIKEYIPQTTLYKTMYQTDLRKNPSLNSEKVETLEPGVIVHVVEVHGEWATVYRNKDFFYAPVQYLDNAELANTTYTKYSYTLSNYIETQRNRVPSYSTSTFESYINPSKCNKFEFLTLNKYRALDVTKLDNMLVSQNAGVLIGHGQTILDVAKKYNIDPLYFISQSLHETGYGKSTLAKGVLINEIANTDKPIKDSNGNITGYEMIPLEEPTMVYNLYGIGAYDNLPTMPNRALVLGTTYAYNKGWTSIEKALDGAGDFVSSGYIHSSKYKQNTLYKMRYNQNPTYIWHQYATTPYYAREIAKFIDKYQDLYINPEFSFDKPLFIGMSEYSLKESIENLNDFTLPIKEDITLNQ